MPRKEFLEANENAVLLALYLADQEYGKPVTTGDVMRVARRFQLDAPRTELGATGGGHRVWDWQDRVLRYLKRLYKKGLVEMTKSGSSYKFSPKIDMDINRYSFYDKLESMDITEKTGTKPSLGTMMGLEDPGEETAVHMDPSHLMDMREAFKSGVMPGYNPRRLKDKN